MHTQGPWEAKHIDGHHLVIVGADGSSIARTQIPFAPATPEANARMLAAAPELLEALEHILEYWNGSHNESAMVNALENIAETANAAIAKATGR